MSNQRQLSRCLSPLRSCVLIFVVASTKETKLFNNVIFYQAYEVKGRTLLKEAEVCLMSPKKPYKVCIRCITNLLQQRELVNLLSIPRLSLCPAPVCSSEKNFHQWKQAFNDSLTEH